MYKIFKGFRGDYHIAASVIESYRDKFDNIVKEYGISDNNTFFKDKVVEYFSEGCIKDD